MCFNTNTTLVWGLKNVICHGYAIVGYLIVTFILISVVIVNLLPILCSLQY